VTVRRRAGGFTLLEVMVALAILGLGLSWIVSATASTVRNSEESRYYDAVTHLTRSKLFDVEEQLRKDGFQDSDQSSEGDFEDEGWPQITWQAEVIKAELPSMDQLQAIAQQQADQQQAAQEGAATGDGGGGLLGAMAMFGGGMGAEDAAGGSFISGQYQLIQQVFEVAIRKLRLTVRWKVIGQDRELVTILYVTDPAAMNRVLGGLGGAGAESYTGDTAAAGAPTGGGARTPRTPAGGGGR
jgi:general secretion pathway protein I